MIKAAFFDIDGTLLSFKTHRIPASAQRVLDSFREQGIACVIATGRPTYQMPDWLFDLGWDAYITLSGQHCFDAKGVYRSCPIDPDDVAVIVDQVARGRYDSLCMQGENSFVNRLSERVVTAGSNAGIVYHEEPFEHAFDAPVYQFCAFVDPADEHTSSFFSRSSFNFTELEAFSSIWASRTSIFSSSAVISSSIVSNSRCSL